jgi:hypothetical protein
MKKVSYSLIWPWAESCVHLETSPPGRAWPRLAQRLAKWPSSLSEPGIACLWPLLPVLATLPCAAHHRPTGATRVRRATQTPRRALLVPVPTSPHPVLGEDFRAKKQNRSVIKNQTDSTKP